MSTFVTLSTPAAQAPSTSPPVLFTFFNLEIPETMRWGGLQKLAVHELVGGARVVDAMGATPADIGWSGWFLDVSLTAGVPMASATARARYLDGLRISGQPLTLAWAGFSYLVVIESFSADFSAFKMPYSIACKVLQDNVAVVTSVAAVSPDVAIGADMSAAAGLAGQIGDATLSGLMGSLQGAVAAGSSFEQATTAVANSVLVPLAAVQAQVAVLQAAVGNTLLNVASLGGVLPYNPVAVQAAALVSQGVAATRAPLLVQLGGLLGRIGQNVVSQETGPNVVTVAGGNLMQLAVRYYGDASEWTTIAQANGLTDPQLSGVLQLIIPNTANGSGGVLNA